MFGDHRSISKVYFMEAQLALKGGDFKIIDFQMYVYRKSNFNK
jgi:hypothetical protein